MSSSDSRTPSSRKARGRPGSAAVDELQRIVGWYFSTVWGRWEGPGVLPFFCDPARVGAFAVAPEALRARNEDSLFRLFVGLSMYQARRDVVIRAQQRAMSPEDVRTLAAPTRLAMLVSTTACDALGDAARFGDRCDVFKRPNDVDCRRHPGIPCPVKDGARLLRRTARLGRLPVSAWLHLRGSFRTLLAQVATATRAPAARAELLVGRLAEVDGVGRKLSTLFVSVLSTPSLYPACAAWWPQVDGHQLVVVDTHVARLVDRLARGAAGSSNASRARWLTEASRFVDLSVLGESVPSFSPRLVQQALYAFGSRSNRSEALDPCALTRCGDCPSTSCPFHGKPGSAALARGAPAGATGSCA